MFVRVGADPNAVDNDGRTALHVACFSFSYHTQQMPFRVSALDYSELFVSQSILHRFAAFSLGLVSES